MGGTSAEQPISLKSGQAVSAALVKAGFNVAEVDLTSNNIRPLDDLDEDVDVIALHGPFGEDGQVQRLLDKRRIPYTGSDVRGSESAMDKLATKRRFAEHGVPAPSYVLASKGCDLRMLERGMSGMAYPVVIKPRSQGSSLAVTIAQTAGAIELALESAWRYDDDALIEQYVSGREFTVSILGEEALPVIELVPKRTFFDYTAKYEAGQTDYVFDSGLDDEIVTSIEGAALDAHNTLGLRDVSRVDMILSPERGPMVLEANSIPGMTDHSLLPMAAARKGISFPELCATLVDRALQRDRRRRGRRL